MHLEICMILICRHAAEYHNINHACFKTHLSVAEVGTAAPLVVTMFAVVFGSSLSVDIAEMLSQNAIVLSTFMLMNQYDFMLS